MSPSTWPRGGVTAFVLKYRLAHTGEDAVQEFNEMLTDGQKLREMLGKTVPLAIADGLAAVTYVRQHASEWGVSPDRVGIMGFSSGGAVTAGVAFHYLPEGRPAFVAPIYSPALGFKDGTVPADAPPMFVAAATDDELGLAPVSVFLYEKWIAARRSEPSICSESLFHDNNLPTLPPKVVFYHVGAISRLC